MATPTLRLNMQRFDLGERAERCRRKWRPAGQCLFRIERGECSSGDRRDDGRSRDENQN